MVMKKDYQKDDMTIKWDSSICSHSGNCVKNLSTVFNPKNRPWIDVNKGSKEEIMQAIDTCPSGALSYVLEHDSDEPFELPPVSVTIVHNGPARIKGRLQFINKDGIEEVKDGVFSLCRCGKTSNSPFCDGTHKNVMPPIDE